MICCVILVIISNIPDIFDIAYTSYITVFYTINEPLILIQVPIF